MCIFLFFLRLLTYIADLCTTNSNTSIVLHFITANSIVLLVALLETQPKPGFEGKKTWNPVKTDPNKQKQWIER